MTTSEQSGITMTACQVNAQIGIAEWLVNGPYHEWRLQSYKCVMGNTFPKAKHEVSAQSLPEGLGALNKVAR